MPRAGKSTWSRQQGLPVVNPDSIRLALHGGTYVPQAEPFVWAICHVMVRALFLAGATTVILDATNTTRARRDEWVSPDWTRKFVLFSQGYNECVRRAGDNAILVSIIKRMRNTWEDLNGTGEYEGDLAGWVTEDGVYFAVVPV